MFTAAEVTGQGPPVLQMTDPVLHTDPLRRVSPAFGLVRGRDGRKHRDLVLPPAGRGVSTAPAVWVLSP